MVTLFLIQNRGAKYRLLGSADRAEMHHEPTYIDYSAADNRFVLDPNSNLYEKLCNMSNGICSFSPQIHLDQNLDCYGKECDVNSLSVVIVQNGDFPVKVSLPCSSYLSYLFSHLSLLNLSIDSKSTNMSELHALSMPFIKVLR